MSRLSAPDLTERLAGLSPDKRELLERRLRARAAETLQTDSIPRRAESGAAPLSFAQQRLFFLDQLEPGSSTYNVPRAIRMTGRLEVEALVRALSEIVRRHETLRSTFSGVDGKPVQVIGPPEPIRFLTVDLRGVPSSEREECARRVVAEEAERPFDLASGPPFRAGLVRLSNDEHILMLTLHHISTDALSAEILFRELADLYGAFASGRPSPLPDPPVQYADYAQWQRGWLSGEVLENQLSYWRKQLARLPVLELPTDHPRPLAQSFRGARRSISFSSELVDGLKELSRREGVTLYMTLLAAFQVLLLRYTGQEDVVVGSPIANRNRGETEGLIGLFLNTLVLRTDLSGDPSFRELLTRVREVAVQAYAHQDLPFEKLVEELQPDRNLGQNPLFQVVMSLQAASPGPFVLTGLTLEPIPVETTTSKFDLALLAEEQGGSLDAHLDYSTDLFEHETIQRMLGHFSNILKSVVSDPHRRLSVLEMLSASERQQVIFDWNRTEKEYPRDKTLHGLFEEQTERSPDAEAVVFGQQRLSYGGLNERANRLARYLRKRGVGPEVLVGVCVERSLEMLVGLLGIVKAGGAYVPLDPAYPRQRLAFMLEDTRAPVVLTQESLADSLPEGNFERVRLDADWAEIARENGENPESGTTAENLAYVMYTSGSTGTPKGVSICHRSIVRLVRGTDYARFGPDEVFLQFAPISFDASTFEIWGALLNGARLAVMPPRLPSLEELGITLERYGVSTLWLTAGLFHQMVDSQIESLRGVRQLLAGGDVLSVPHVEKALRELPDCRLINGYGPTENTTFTCCHTVSRDEPLGASVPIGRPIANTRVFILDRNGQPVPIGVPGELCIGGDGLAREYLKRPELTAEKFVRNPFSGDGERRLYRTGDRVRYRPDGTIEFLGRIDDQVKIRGFRIEPGEVESVLAQHPGVAESIVLAREDTPGDKRLIAYVVAGGGAPPSAMQLREFSKSSLPDYLVPSDFVFLAAIPLTPNGKVDRRALPAPEHTRPELEETFVAPRNTIEQTLARVWGQVLGLERVGVHDNFFELGGDSILAIQIIARAAREGLRLTPRQLFERQTVAELAAVAETSSSTQAEQGSVTGPVPLTPIQHWFFEQDLLDPHHFNQSMFLEAREPLDREALEAALDVLMTHHDALRLRFVQDGNGWRQSSAAAESGRVFSVLPLDGLGEAEQAIAIDEAAAQAQASLNLSEGPIVRALLFDLGSRKPSRLLLIVHHLAVDSVSWRVLLEDLENAYLQIREGRAVALPPKTNSFRAWAEKLTELAASGTLEREAPYWLSHTEESSATLPLDSEGENTEGSAASVVSAFSEEETRALLQEVPAVYRTQINDVLLTALAEAFDRNAGSRSLLIDLEGHGREEIVAGIDLSRTVGWFTTRFPVLLELPDSAGPGERLVAVKESWSPFA